MIMMTMMMIILGPPCYETVDVHLSLPQVTSDDLRRQVCQWLDVHASAEGSLVLHPCSLQDTHELVAVDRIALEGYYYLTAAITAIITTTIIIIMIRATVSITIDVNSTKATSTTTTT